MNHPPTSDGFDLSTPHFINHSMQLDFHIYNSFFAFTPPFLVQHKCYYVLVLFAIYHPRRASGLEDEVQVKYSFVWAHQTMHMGENHKETK